jgi:gluconolactonase
MHCAGNHTLVGAFLVAVICGCSSQSTTLPGGGAGSVASSGGGSGGATGSSGNAGSSGGSASGSGSASGGNGSSGSGSASGGSGGSSGSANGGGDGGLQTYPPLTSSAVSALQAVLVPGQFYFTEGPVWDPKKNVLYFTDIQAHQGTQNVGAIYRLTLPNQIDALLEPDGNTDGIGLDPQGNIIAAGFASREVWRLSNGIMQPLATCSSSASTTCYNGQEVNTPDDITSRADGIIYFTDPTFGSGLGLPNQTFVLGSAQGVYRLTQDGALHVEDTSTQGPNGVNLSPDQTTLYVAYTLGGSVAKFDVQPDGSLKNKQTFATGTTLADSMCVDHGGNVYVGTYSGLAVFNPAGQALGTVAAGGQIVTNCAFGGADQKTLFITARAQSTLTGTPAMGNGFLYKVDSMPVPGIPGQN